MHRLRSSATGVFCTVLLAAISALAQINRVNQTGAAPTGGGLALNLSSVAGGRVHILPPVHKLAALAAQNNGGTPPLLYNGGPVMLTPKVYAIYWVPPHLQDGSATSMSTQYQTIQSNMLKEYWGHSLATNNTQYYQGAGTAKKYIKSAGALGGSYVDTALYPGMDCSDVTAEIPNPLNCISDTDIQNEVKKVMALKGWTGGVNHMFLVFTSLNEGSCAAAGVCSYNYYCAYHGSFVNGTQDVVYSNEPYGDTNVCQIPGAPSPNGNPVADAAATGASHELTEAITDPLLNAWFDSSGYEIGDECAYSYGFAGYNGGNANELWDGKPFFLQTEYSNVLSGWYISDPNFPGCFNAGPDL